MSDSLAALLREAYAAGWAASGGPMTGRVHAGCTAAVSLGLQYSNRPGLLEATLHLGHLEGVWASIYARRDELHAHNRTAVAQVWYPLVADLDLPTLIRHVRRDAGLREAVSKAAIGRIVDAVLNLLNQVRHRTGWRELRRAVRDALARSRAEGRADAVALAMDAAHHIAIDFAIPFDDAYRALEHAQDLLTEADEWMLRIIGDQASALGRELAILTRDGASYQDMLDAAQGLLEGSDPEAVGLVVDQLTARALSQGALDLYRAEGVEQVDFLTAGDGRVCFPAGTPVCTPTGDRPIETLKVGDLVSTPRGPRRVTGVASRPYDGVMVGVLAGSAVVTATIDHPFWTPEGWTSAGSLQPGSRLQTVQDELIEVSRVVHFQLGKSDDPPTCGGHAGVLSRVPLGGAGMPVSTVYLQGHPQVRQQEVNRPASNPAFLLEDNAEPFQGGANTGLQSILATEAAVARDVAEASDVGCARLSTSGVAALETGEERRGPTAPFGAVVPVQVLFCPEPLSASLAVDVLRVPSCACNGTGAIPMRDGALGDGERSTAYRAHLRDRVGSGYLVAGTGTELPCPVSVLRVEVESALDAQPSGVDGLGETVATARTEDPGQARLHCLGATHEDFAALITGESERQSAPSDSTVFGGNQIQVYDIEVEDAHVFYAAGLLVHNCHICSDAEANNPYPLNRAPVPGLHPRCRCTVATPEPLPTAVATYLKGA